ncbi:hypothetical protein MMC13_006334 [Lambiella insularis]|nr:hypothetical protein [Lambiella insularis]
MVSLLLGIALAYDPHFAARRDALPQRRDARAIYHPAAGLEAHFGPVSRRHLMAPRGTVQVQQSQMQQFQAQQGQQMKNSAQMQKQQAQMSKVSNKLASN